jgi:hypothetical protein
VHKIGKPNKLEVMGTRKPNGLNMISKNQLISLMHERGEPYLTIFIYIVTFSSISLVEIYFAGNARQFYNYSKAMVYIVQHETKRSMFHLL